jgi:hypothetical protein
MTLNRQQEPNAPIAALRRLKRERVSAPVERCELCAAAIAEEHPHLIEPATRKLACACDACALLFDRQDGGRYRRVPRRIRFLEDFRLTEAQWDALMIPINMAFFFRSTPADRIVALYPSPAGPTESTLTFESWRELEEANPVLSTIEPDVEALLVQRIGSAEYYIAPIDECYKLVGVIRARWRGLSGGAEVWAEINRFFGDLKARAHTVSEAPRA